MTIPALMLALIASVATARGQEPIVTEGVVAAPLDSVWNAFTTSAGLESWMAAHASFDLRIGGTMQTVYAPAGRLGDVSTIRSTVLAYEPKRMLSTRVAQAPARFPFPNAIKNMWTVIYFEPIDAKTTGIREVSLGFGPDDESQKMRQFFEGGNAATLAALQQRFAEKPR